MTVKISKSRLKVSAAIILIFTLGFLAGSIGTGIFVKQKIMKMGRGTDPMAARVLKRLTGRLGLSGEQEVEVGRILEKSSAELGRIREKYFPEFRKILQESVEEIDKVLDPEQKKKFEKLRKRLEKRSPFKGPGRRLFGGPGFRGDKGARIFGKLADRLSLTEEQAEKVRPILEENIRNRRRMIRENRERRKPLPLKEMRENRRDMEEALGSVLTEEQIGELRIFFNELRSGKGVKGPGREAFE